MRSLFNKLLTKKLLWRVLTIVFIILASLMFALSGIAGLYAPVINQALGIETSASAGGDETGEQNTYYYKSSYSTLEEMYQAKVSLLREIGQEGTVLLKNESNTLPIKSGKAIVLGEDNFIYETTNAGGMIKIDHSLCASLSDGLKLNGLTVTDSLSGATASDTAIVIIGRASGESIDYSADKLKLTADEKTLISQAKNSGAKVVLLISGDFNVEMDEYKYDSAIGAIIKFGNAGYRGAYGLADVITGEVSPSGKLIETSAANNMSAPAAVNSGDFSYTNKSSISTNLSNNYLVYQEGIYIDYKYYETRYEDCVLGNGNASSTTGTYASKDGWKYSEEVSYPFGYGISYTTFTKEIVGEPVYNAEDDTWKVSVKVSNAEDGVAGKEVVQVYAQTPYTQYDKDNKVEKPSVSLMGFAKTGVIEPGADETVEVTIHQQWLASYDYTTAKGYIMDAGDYYLSVGNGSHEAINNILAAKGKTTSDGMDEAGDASLAVKIEPAITATETEPDKTVYQYIYNDKTKVTNAFADTDINYYMSDANKITYLSRNSWDTTYPQALTSITATNDMLTSLNEKKKYDKGLIDTAERAEKDESIKYSNSGRDKFNGISVFTMKGKSYDDEGWNEILDKMSIQDMSYMVANGRFTIPTATSVAFPEVKGNDNPTGLWNHYIYSEINAETGKTTEISATMTVKDGITDDSVAVSDLMASMYSSEPVLGASFNQELAARQGDMFAEDALWCGQTFVWGLGVNIHRTPFGGRASEYFSADSVLSTVMGSEWNKAALKKGCIMVVKHFVANEQETNRSGVCTFLNEQTLREIYLRAFEGISVYGDMKGLMTSYNRLGLISTAAEYDLMTVVLRDEWGYDGYTITDLYNITEGLYVGKEMVVAGTNIMLGTGYDKDGGTYVQKTLNVENIISDPQLLTAVRNSCHRLMYVFVNSNAMNGRTADSTSTNVTPFYIPLLITFEVLFTLVAVGASVMYILSNTKLAKKEENKND